MNARNHTIERIRCAATLAAALIILLSAVAPAAAISRSTITARGKRWVDLRVPYGQSLFFEGYRQDCSGFVSMCWVLSRNGTPYSPSTADLDAPTLVEPITKEALQPGDMILRPKDAPGAPYGHAVLFVGWADPGHTRYVGYHQSSSGGGAVMATIPYPFWDATGFSPYRYRGVGDDYLDVIDPVYGQTRYETAVKAAWKAFPETGDAGAVVLATGENWPDALGGSALAGALDAPVLLTKSDVLPAEVRAEIERLATGRVVVLGGPSSVSTAVVEAVDAIPGTSVERIGGSDRWETAAMVAARTIAELRADGEDPDGLYLATGRAFPDALAASPASYASGRPILLTDPSWLPTATVTAITDLSLERAWVLGGEGAVGTTVTAGVEGLGLSWERLSGEDRYSTALVVASHAERDLGLGWRDVALATGQSYADALVGGAAQGATGSVLVLTPGASLHPGVAGALSSRRSTIDRVRCLGGTAAVGDVTRAQIASAVRGS